MTLHFPKLQHCCRKMSFEISKIMGKNDIAPTLVAMDMQHLYVTDGMGVRTLSLREGFACLDIQMIISIERA